MLLLFFLVVDPLAAKADVGIEEGGFPTSELTSILGEDGWELTENGCFLGEAQHLVVEPGYNDNFLTPQILRTDTTGVHLCRWLDALYDFHRKQRPKWESKHRKRKRKAAGIFSLFTRVRLHFRSFPNFKVVVRTRYLALWHDDRFGKPMPWMSGYFCYETGEEDDSSYGVFVLSTPQCFVLKGKQQKGGAKLVHLLINPHKFANKRLPQYEHPRSHSVPRTAGVFLSGLAAAAPALMKRDTSENEFDLIAAASTAITHYLVEMPVRDFWLRGATCYIRTRLVLAHVHGPLICQEVSRVGSECGAFGLWKTHYLSSVKLRIMSIDLFTQATALLQVSMSRGWLDSKIVGVYFLGFDTDPQVIPDYVHAMEAAKYARITVAIGGAVRAGVDTLQRRFAVARPAARRDDQRWRQFVDIGLNNAAMAAAAAR